jgi:O-antigen chain-terminating methyltransferase
LLPWALKRDAARLEAETSALHSRCDELADRLSESNLRFEGVDRRFDAVEHRVAQLEERRDSVEERLATIAAEREALEVTRTEVVERTARLEARQDQTEHDTRVASDEVGRLRDEVIPAIVERGNVLVDRLADEIEEVASLVERMLLSEPLPAPSADTDHRLAGALAEIQPRLLAAFRGTEEEIRHRLDHHLPKLREAAPVLDIGCGRGELLLMLREAGVDASGIEADAALVQAARRRGLDVIEGDALDSLRAQPDDSRGAITAIHLFEHFEVDRLQALLAEARRVLRPGGVLLVECPNPHCLRVGASLYWQDPTHLRPLLPESLELYLEAGGFQVLELEYLHPFPAEQRLSSDELSAADLPPELAPLAERFERLAGRLDDLLNGPRDFAITAAKPTS